MSEYQVSIVIKRIDPNGTITEIDQDYLTTYSNQDSAEDYLQWATGKVLYDTTE